MLRETTLLSGDPITTIDSLPDELLFDILVRLAADYLYDRARLVCSRWRSIIQYSDVFTTTHTQHHSTYGLVLSLISAAPPPSLYATATPDGRIETSEFSYKFLVQTTANGLVVESNHGALYVINPATKQSFLLPSHPDLCAYGFYHCRCGIAYSAASMEYKVTLPYNTKRQCGLNIATVGVDKAWRRVELPSLVERFVPLFNEFPVSSEGFLHWASDGYCLTLNVKTETFTMSEVPSHPKHHLYYYLSTGRYLSLLVGHRKELWWEVWEMRPTESGEWRRKAVLSDIDLEESACGGDINCLIPLGWVKYPEVLAFRVLDPTKTCIFYNLKTRQISTIDLPCNLCYTATVHKNSLVWLS